MISVLRRVALDIAAASGLVLRDGRLLVVADDELALAVYALDGTPQGKIPLLAGTLPDEPAARKRAKPDLEALVLLFDGSLLALGSGSRPGRARGVWLAPDPREVDLAPLYARLAEEIRELNIEGAAVVGDALWLAQRGNGRRGDNAIVELEVAGVMAALAAGRAVPAGVVRGVRRVALGAREGVPLTFTDLAPAGKALWFVAAAEDTLDPFEDGPCRGSAIGLVTAEGVVVGQWNVPGQDKIEGLAVAADGLLYMVTDADTRGARADLLVARLTAGRDGPW